jgi:imidazolonepropionase-like amidohydrolase
LLLASGSALAQTFVLQAGHVIDPATGAVTDNQKILVQDGKITEVGSDIKVPEGATIVDLSRSWVLPGLMDAHVHLTVGLPPREGTGAGYDPWTSMLTNESSAFRALRGIRTARTVLEAGFTAVKDIGNSDNYVDADLRRAIERGWFPGPTILNTGKIIAPFGGQDGGVSPESYKMWQVEYIDADSPDEVRKAVRQNIFYGANAIKLVADNSAYYYSEEEIRAAVTEAHQAGVTVAVHVVRDEPARDVILGGADSIEHGWFLGEDILKLMKEHGTVLVGTEFPEKHMAQYWDPARAKAAYEIYVKRLSKAHEIGVKLAFGSDTVVDLPGKTRADMMFDYLDVWEEAGIPPAAILKAWITNNAELFEIADERGAIAKGLAADIIATPENPLEDVQALRKVHFVMKDGAIIRDEQ